MDNSSRIIGVIGGSGLYQLDGLEDMKTIDVDTPFGKPSDQVTSGRLGNTHMLFLPRHGRGHRLSPSEIPYQANIWALKHLGAQWVIGVSAVGSLKEHIKPGHVVIPDQFLDITRGRTGTFFGDGVVAHVSMADPVCTELACQLQRAGASTGASIHMGGTYVCMEGPAFSTRAESRLYQSWGMDIIGMTNMPEAKLAREAELCFSTLALVTDYDCWHEEEEAVSANAVSQIMQSNINIAKKVLCNLAEILPADRNCTCVNALQNALMADMRLLSQSTRTKYELLVGKYLPCLEECTASINSNNSKYPSTCDCSNTTAGATGAAASEDVR